MESLKIVKNVPLTSLIKLRSLTNGNSKRMLNAVNERSVLTFKINGYLKFSILAVETNR